MRFLKNLLLGIFFLPNVFCSAQESSPFISQLKDFNIQPYIQFQVWGTYTMGQEIFDDSLGTYRKVGNRYNTQLRRGRFGFKGRPYPWLSFNITGALDFVGRDVYSGTVGASNPAPFPDIELWQVYLTWKISQQDESLHLTAGYFPPMFSRATIVSAFSSTSLEKSFSQNYIRRHLVGTGPGRAVGLDLGGIIAPENGIGLLYHLGIFSPLHTVRPGSSLTQISAGEQAPLLLTGKANLQIGDPELSRYKLFLDVNHYGKRKGLSLGMSGSYQGQTDLFTENYAWGPDFSFNWGPFNSDGEWIWLNRSGERMENGVIRSFSYGSQAGFLRLSMNVLVEEKYLLEPMFMWQGFRGKTDAAGQADARAVNFDSGTEDHYELGLNWYLNKRDMKLSLHYIWRGGDLGSLEEGSRINLYFNQGGAGAIRRGDYVGLGLQALIN